MRVDQFRRFLVISVVLLTGPAAVPAPAVASARDRHCVSHAVREDSGEQPVASACFRTFAEAIGYATGGAVRLTPSATTVTQAELDAGYAATRSRGLTVTGVVIGVSYWNTGYSGSTLIHEATEGCGSFSWRIPNVGTFWNDRISSAKAYANCRGIYYEHHDFGGASIGTAWSGGAMNDRTTSIRWSVA